MKQIFHSAVAVIAFAGNLFAASLPPEYQAVEYIEATGAQRLNLGIQPNGSTVTRLKFSYTKAGGNVFYGTTGSADSNDYRLFSLNGFPNSYFDLKGSKLTFQWFKANTTNELEVGNFYVVDGLTGNILAQGTPQFLQNFSYDLTLFGANDYGKVFWVQISSGFRLEHDFRPCYERANPDNAGLYDLVTGTFIGNSGDGTLLTGPDCTLVTDVLANWVSKTEPPTYPGNVLHVATTGNDGTATGTADAPFATIAAALAAAVDGDTVLVERGLYPLEGELLHDKAVVLRGATGNPEDVILSIQPSLKQRLFKINNSAAQIANFTLTGGRPAADNGGAVLFGDNGGRLVNCVIRDSQPQAWATQGGAFYIPAKARAALVDSCVVSNCNCSTAGNGTAQEYGGGTAASICAGTVRNCLFIGNGALNATSNKGGTLFVSGGEVMNCTIAANQDYWCAGIRATGGAVANCIITGNKVASDGSGHSSVWLDEANAFTACAADLLVNASCFTASKIVADMAAGDFTPEAVAVDRGLSFDWMETDLAGNNRISGAGPDLGCFERDVNVFSVSVSPSATFGIAPVSIDFDVIAYGIGESGISCEWDWDGNGVFDETTAGNATHQFSVAGEATVAVRVTDVASGNTVTKRNVVTLRISSKTLYVDASSASPAAPYASWEHAANTVADALTEAVDGCEIIIAPGRYSVPAQLDITAGVTVRGETGNPEDVVLAKSGNSHRIISMNHADAVLAGVAVEGGKIENNTTMYTKNGGGIMICDRGGTVSNCIVRACRTWIWGNEGDGIYIIAGANDALVTHTVISNCVSDTSAANDTGNALTMYAGNVRNCLFCNNKVTANNTTLRHAYGTVTVGGGTLENCTVAGNSSFNCSGIYATGGRVVNCLIAGNTSELYSGNADYTVWAGTASCFENCIAPIKINDSCFVEPAAESFVNAASGDYSLPTTSAAFNTGLTLDWMTSGATDLVGNKRISGSAPDIGAYEADAEKFSAGVRAKSPISGFAPLTVEFEAMPVNASGLVRCLWDFDGDGVYETESDGLTVSRDFTTAGVYPVRLKVVDAFSGYEVPTVIEVKAAPKTLYVDVNAENPQAPYATWDTAATSIQEAVDWAIDGCEVAIARGEYRISGQIAVDKAIHIHGTTSNPEDTIIRNTLKTGATARIFYLNNPGAKVSGLVATDGYIMNNTTVTSKQGAGIFIAANGGTVSNCVVRNSNIYMWGNQGGGIYIDSGAVNALVTHCVVTNCHGANRSGKAGVGIAMLAGSVRNTLVAYCWDDDTDTQVTAPFGAVYVGGGEFANCTVAFNRSMQCSGIVADGNGRVINCAIGENVSTSPTDSNDTWSGTASCFERTIGRVAVNENCFAGTGLFRNAAKGDFRLFADSPAVNLGFKLPWMTSGSTDLAGFPRCVSKPDAGCYECQSGTSTMLILR